MNSDRNQPIERQALKAKLQAIMKQKKGERIDNLLSDNDNYDRCRLIGLNKKKWSQEHNIILEDILILKGQIESYPE